MKLAEENYTAEVVGVVGGEAFQLLAYGHDSNWLAGAGWAADGAIKVGFIGGDCCRLPGAGDEASAEFVPAFVFCVGMGGKAGGRGDEEWSFDASDPVDGDLLPEDDVPELLIDRVWGAWDDAVGEAGIEPFDDVGRVGCVAVCDEALASSFIRYFPGSVWCMKSMR